ncbi:xanthine dehydrogenase accessory factor [Parasphingorhabdus marina DSM 22363]|uniref:Xanthine dehydrogenase accessory factor n=1 Tax=Parasphingorhabdus marina DSM 22363 TaxID=1123272 RepID=A0A1N6CXT3_9SPHN|nr:XdhC family protein [Parasphingorhabdus marina]SIN63350.1 xanthine dehydrogenase accessory factor [Parasphingorhabdus marina DSM 22363]
MDNKDIFRFLSDALNKGQRCVLVTVASVSGSSMRDPGAHMAVSDDGRFTGSLSGGCIEAAVVAEAQSVLAENCPRVVRFGEGSPYLDIRLPCGGGLDIHFLPIGDDGLVAHCNDALARREPFGLRLPCNSGAGEFLEEPRETVWRQDQDHVEVAHWPSPKLLIAGHGAASVKVARMAESMKMDVAFHSSDEQLVKELDEGGFEARLLKTPRDTAQLSADPWTAIIFMFHDHDWEGHLMEHALGLPHFYIGAMGGKLAHARRKETLAALGATAEQIASIHAPIGLFHSSRDPDTLALSVVAEVTAEYHRSMCRRSSEE